MRVTSKTIADFTSQPLFDEEVILARDPSWPRISIVTPSYNQAEFLERTILSVLNQNYPNLEYIIIDGGSTDGSPEIIKKYEKYLAYWVSEPDKGQSDAINKGFQKSSGEILAWLNSDDTYLPNALWTAARFFEEHPDVDMLYGRCNIINRGNKICREAKSMPFNFLDYVYGLFTIPQPAAFWRRGIFFKVGMLNVHNYTCMDHELWLNYVKHKASIVYIDRFLANFRLHPQSITVSGRYRSQYHQDLSRIEEAALRYHPSRTRKFLRRLAYPIKHPIRHIQYFAYNLTAKAGFHK